MYDHENCLYMHLLIITHSCSFQSVFQTDILKVPNMFFKQSLGKFLKFMKTLSSFQSSFEQFIRNTCSPIHTCTYLIKQLCISRAVHIIMQIRASSFGLERGKNVISVILTWYDCQCQTGWFIYFYNCFYNLLGFSRIYRKWCKKTKHFVCSNHTEVIEITLVPYSNVWSDRKALDLCLILCIVLLSPDWLIR